MRETGTMEINNIETFGGTAPEAGAPAVHLHDARLGRITRLRLLGDYGFPFLDVSYCWGVLKDGTPCRVYLPRESFSVRTYKRQLVEMCEEAGVYGVGLGLFRQEVISIYR